MNPYGQPWPWRPGEQGQTLHLDLTTESPEEAVAYAKQCGAIPAEDVYFDGSRTPFDPAGRPFRIDAFHA